MNAKNTLPLYSVVCKWNCCKDRLNQWYFSVFQQSSGSIIGLVFFAKNPWWVKSLFDNTYSEYSRADYDSTSMVCNQ